MKNSILIFAMVFLMNSNSFADLYMETRTSTSQSSTVGKMQTYFSKIGFRMEMYVPPYINSMFIIRIKDNWAYFLDPAKKTYTVERANGAFSGPNKAAKGSPYADAMSRMKMKESIKVLNKSAGPTMLGFPTTYYKIDKTMEMDLSALVPKGMEGLMPKGAGGNQTQKSILELWIADKVKPNTGMDNELKEMQKSIEKSFSSMKMELSKELKDIQDSGIILKSVETSAKSGTTKSEVVKLTQTPLPDNLFVPPYGYKKVESTK